jgi:V/A-type H+-transporting ATPase subunit D
MAEIKLTKTELRLQQTRLTQLQRYLPTLQLKKAMLQIEVNNSRQEIEQIKQSYNQLHHQMEGYSALLSDKAVFDPEQALKIIRINKQYENIAGVEVPIFESVSFEDFDYNLFDTPAWIDPAIKGLRSLASEKAKIAVAKEKRSALEKELKEVAIRVNLFEKILIPRSIKDIKRIKVFLGDQQLAAVSQAKVAKGKIIKRMTLKLQNGQLLKLLKKPFAETLYAN